MAGEAKTRHQESGGFIDVHCHAVPRDGTLHVRGWRRALYHLIAGHTGAGGSGRAAADGYTRKLASFLRTARYVSRAVLISLDGEYDEYGAPSRERASFSVTNEDVVAWCRETPGLFLFGASVHPNRKDALEALDRCAENGAVLVKWLPNTQGIDPADRRHVAYYRRLCDLRLPLLSHTGWEFALPASRQAVGSLARLRLPLEEGVTVIAAHSGSSGLFLWPAAFGLFESMLAQYPNLYGDTAGLAAPNRMEALLWWRRHPELSDRLLFATDYPIPMVAAPWRPFLSRDAYARFAGEKNPFDRMALLLQGIGVRPRQDGFQRLLQGLGRKL
jgi:hypothetical protein